MRFFGATQYAVVNHSNVVAWSKNDDKSRFAAGTKKPAFSRAVAEAAEAAAERQKERVGREKDGGLVAPLSLLLPTVTPSSLALSKKSGESPGVIVPLNFRAFAPQEAFANELRGKQVEGAPKYTRIKNNSYLVPKERHGAQPDACSCEKVEGGCGEVSA